MRGIMSGGLLLAGLYLQSQVGWGLRTTAIQDEVKEVMARETGGFHNGRFNTFFDNLQSRFKKPLPENDWMIDSYMFVGAQKIIADRAGFTCKGVLDGEDAFLVFREQLENIYRNRLKLPDNIAAALAAGLESEARELAGLPPTEINLEAFRVAATELLESSKIYDRCQVPYIAGYNVNNGNEIYIDRDVPKTIEYSGKTIPVFTLLNLHERVEKALMDEYQLIYQHAHQVALRTERLASLAMGVSWKDYDDFILKIYDKIDARSTPRWIAKNLDQRPYLSYADESSYKLIEKMRQSLVDPEACPPRTVDEARPTRY